MYCERGHKVQPNNLDHFYTKMAILLKHLRLLILNQNHLMNLSLHGFQSRISHCKLDPNHRPAPDCMVHFKRGINFVFQSDIIVHPYMISNFLNYQHHSTIISEMVIITILCCLLLYSSALFGFVAKDALMDIAPKIV